MKDFFIRVLIWFYEHPIVFAILALVVYYLLVGKYLDKPAGEVPTWVLM
jgi:hypothetical protein